MSPADNDPGIERSFLAALGAAERSPESDDAWDHLEELADQLQRPEEVANLYQQILRSGLSQSLHDHLANRAVNFHEEWFGDNPKATAKLLGEIVERDPQARWAFDRLTVVLTSAEQWGDLLGVYDRAMAETRDKKLRKQLLTDAAHVAKDFANEADRAADYMTELLLLDSDNQKLEGSLARLLERQSRWEDLIALWRRKLDSLAPVEARQLRVQIARCYREQLSQFDRTLHELDSVLTESPGHEESCKELEQVLTLEKAKVEQRKSALAMLRKNYDAAERPRDVVRVLERALGFLEAEDRRAAHRELGARLAILGDDEEAMRHYGALLEGDPADADALKQLRQIAQRSGHHDLHVKALVAAADLALDGGLQVMLLLEAAHRTRDILKDADTSISLYQRVLNSEDADPVAALTAAHILNELLAAAGRAEERLAVLERLAKIEKVTAIRRAVLGEAAVLAAELGDVDRSLHDWRRRLKLDPNDLESLNALVQLLAGENRHGELVEVLSMRADAPVVAQQRRMDLVWIARLQAEKLGRLGDAIDTWLKIRQEFGEDDDMLDALDELLSVENRFEELVTLLDGSAAEGRGRTADLLARVGDILRCELQRAEQAAVCYAQSLAVVPEHNVARVGLRELLQVKACREASVTALVRAYETTDDWGQILEVVEPRLSVTNDPVRRASILRESANLWLDRADDADAALRALVRAFPLDPTNVALEHEMLRLASVVGLWGETADALAAGAERAVDNPSRSAQLSFAEGGIREHELRDPMGATDAYLAAARLDPQRLEIHEAVARCAAQAARWGEAAAAAVHSLQVRERLEGSIVENLEDTAQTQNAWHELANAFERTVLENAALLRPTLTWALEMKLASWFVRAEDLDGAERSARRAVTGEPTNIDSLNLLAGLQRERVPARLVDTLLQLDSLNDNDLDTLREACDVTRELGNESKLQGILVRLFRKSARMWARNDPASGEHQVEDCAKWALENLVALQLSKRSIEQAVRTLLDGATLPVAPEESRSIRRRAAELLAEDGQRDRAIGLLLGIFAEQPDDLQILTRLASLCDEAGRTTELLSLRRQELELTDDQDRRLELRLEISQLTGSIEAQRGRVDSLKDNLAEMPGHPESVTALEKLLTQRNKLPELTAILEQQAGFLGKSNPAASADLWTRSAVYAEKSLDDANRAIADLEKAVALEPKPRRLDDLARLCLAQSRPAEAAQWLLARLNDAAENERVAIRIKLARAQVRAGQEEAAIETLEQAFTEAPRNGEVRKLLLGLYRQREDWPALASTLSRAAGHIGDTATILGYARESAEIYARLGTPELSVPVLRKAVELAPADRPLRGMLAEGLLAAGELDEAQSLLEQLIKDFGRRRSAARALVHLQLARVFHAQGKVQEAIESLETASRMDSANTKILRTLAELAQADGQYDRAERAYRTLLVNVRRSSQNETPSDIGPCEVMLELSRIAAERGDADRAAELIESALEVLGSGDDELERLKTDLAARNEHELLRRVLKTRLEHVEEGTTRADLLNDLAGVLEGPLERPSDAFAMRLDAIASDPGSPPRYEPARKLAETLDKTEAYRKHLQDLLAASRRESDAHIRCELLLRLGEVSEHAEAFDEAADLYLQAEATGVRKVDVWRAQARLAAARGDRELQMVLLEQLVSLGADQAETRADAFYRMAEVHLADATAVGEGVEALRQALDESPHYERAGMILRRACEAHPPHNDLLDLYELVARKSTDQGMLLHYLERRANQANRNVLETIAVAREGVDLGIELYEWERAEALLMRAIELGEDAPGGLAAVDWAMLTLARRRHETGDAAGAVKWLGEAIDVAVSDEVLALAREVAKQAGGPDGDLTLAAKLYERMVEREPTAREGWAPLAAIYRQLGDLDSLDRLVLETLDGLQTAGERNELRLELAQALLATDGRGEDAVRVLNDILFDQPDHAEAQHLLAEHLEASGDTDGLLNLLRTQRMAAQERGDTAALKTISMELARRLRGRDISEARSVCESALAYTPEDVELLRMMLDLDEGAYEVHERAALLERLLKVEEVQRVPALALALVDLREQQGDKMGALQALQHGYRRVPGHPDLHGPLEQRYRDAEDFDGLFSMLVDAAGAEGTSDNDAANLLCQAAVVKRDLLDDPASAVDLLVRACKLGDGAHNLQLELAQTQARARRFADAIATLTACLEQAGDDPAMRLDLLRRRAAVHNSAGDRVDAVADLDAAHKIDAAAVADDLMHALNGLRIDSGIAGDHETERTLTLRLYDLRLASQQRVEARELLVGWVREHTNDVEALQRLRSLDRSSGRWEDVVKTCQQLCRLLEGQAQIDAALGLVEACGSLQRLPDARETLEQVREQQPQSQAIRDHLRVIYRTAGGESARELAGVLLDDARSGKSSQPRLALLREAGDLYLGCGDHKAAIPVLREVLADAPDDRETIQLLARALSEAGDLDGARTLVGEQLQRADDSQWQLSLLKLRATYHQAAGALADAVADLESAYAIDPATVAEPLVEALAAMRGQADNAAERTVVMRLYQVQLERGARDAARDLLVGWTQTASDDVDALQLLRKHRAKDGDWTEVADICRQLLTLVTGEDQAEAAIGLFDACTKMASPDAARDGLETVQSAQPEHQGVRSRLRSIYEANGADIELAKLVLLDAAEATDDATRLDHLRRASTLLLGGGETETAIPVLLQIIELDQLDTETVFALTDAYLATGQHEQAAKTLGRAMEALTAAEQPVLELLRRRAAVRQEGGDGEGGLEDLEAAYKLDAATVSAELEDAILDLRAAAADAGDTAKQRDLSLRLCEVRLDRGDRADARDILTELAERAPDDLEVLHRLRAVDTADENWAGVAEVCRRLAEVDEGPRQIEAALSLLQACSELGHPEDAREGLEVARRAQPEAAGELRDALREIYEALEADRELADILLDDAQYAADDALRLDFLRRAGELLLNVEDTEAAIPVLEEVYKLDPTDHDTVVILADAHMMTGNLDKADALLDQVIGSFRKKRSPEIAFFHHCKARVASARGDRQAELEHLQTAFSCDKNNGSVAAELADLAEELENWDVATKVLRTIALMEGDCPISRAEAYLRQGYICQRQGDTKRALFWARRAHQEDHDLEAAQELIDDLSS